MARVTEKGNLFLKKSYCTLKALNYIKYEKELKYHMETGDLLESLQFPKQIYVIRCGTPTEPQDEISKKKWTYTKIST